MQDKDLDERIKLVIRAYQETVKETYKPKTPIYKPVIGYKPREPTKND